MNTSPQTPANILKAKANAIRCQNLRMLTHARLGHTGGDLSVTDILAVLYFAVLNIDPQQPAWLERDRLTLIKGHRAGAPYTTPAMRGFFLVDDLNNIAQP